MSWRRLVLQRCSWDRLASSIETYDQELDGRAKLSGSPARLAVAQDLLKCARDALQAGNIDQGWKCFHCAQRLELLALEPEEWDAAAEVIRNEAEKLSGWRKKAIL